MPVENVSDTARWVAVYRAMETERADAHFKDPYARRLAGEHGEEIVTNMKWGRRMAWAMIVRTQVMDEIILREVRNGADCVLNIAAGLDARPWRLDVPASLHWVDADLPGILNYKTDTLRNEKPRCRYEAVTVDLTDAAARRALFARVGKESKRVLVVAEGLLIYLTEEQVGALAADLSAQPAFALWLSDLASPQLLKWMQRTWGDKRMATNAPFRFAPQAGTGFFESFGWREREYRSSWQESIRLDRKMPMAWLWGLFALLQSKKKKEEMARFSGFVLLERTAAK